MAPQGRGIVSWILMAAFFLAVPYVPTLFSGFDFNDDGCLVYPKKVHGVGEWLRHVADRTYDDFHFRGPFRPMCWMHWTAASELLGANPFPNRLMRLGWTYLAAALFLWLLAELGCLTKGGWPAFFAAAVAFWSPFRNEYWIGLGLTEAFGTPYGFLGLIAAVRAARSTRPWTWDVLGWTCALAAIACKNTFAAVVPAMLFLRLCAGGLSLGTALLRHWPGLLFLGSVLIFPFAHLLALKLDPFPKDYKVVGITWHGISVWPKALLAAFGFSYLLPALVLFGVAFWRGRRGEGERGRKGEGEKGEKGRRGEGEERSISCDDPTPCGARLASFAPLLPFSSSPPLPLSPSPPLPLSPSPLLPLFPGLLLVLAGVGIYLPLPPAVSGRYTVPAAWGCDLILAQFFGLAFALPAGIWKRAGVAALVLGVAGMLVANVGKQSKCLGRAELFWQVIHVIEDELPDSSKIAWVGARFPNAEQIGLGEGTHFNWHLRFRGRKMAALILVDETDPHGLESANFACTAGPQPPPGHWQLLHSFRSRYWLGLRSFACYLWEASPPDSGS